MIPAALVLLLQQTPPPATDLRRFRPQPPPASSVGERARQQSPGAKPPASKDLEIQHYSVLNLRSDGLREALGDVRFTIEGYRVRCDRAIFDDERNYATLEGNVVLETEGQTVHAEKVGLNIKTREFTADEGRTTVPPEKVGQNLLQPLQIWGKSVERVGDLIIAKDGFLTTCDLDHPHAKIGFRQATVFPKKRIVLRDATFYRYETPILRIKHLSIPITEEVRYSWLPLLGRTNEEGYFIKAVVGYSLTHTLPGLLRVDLMEKKGVGVGFDQAYRSGQNIAGTAALYSLKDRNRNVNNLSGRLSHDQRFGQLDLRISSDFQNNSYQSVSANSKTRNSTITLSRNIGSDQTSLSVSLTGSTSGSSISSGTSYTLSQTRRLGNNGTLSLRLTSNDTNSLFGEGDARVNTGRRDGVGELRASGEAGAFRYELTANKQLLNKSKAASDGGVGAFFTGTERLPELTLTADPRKLGRLGKILPATVSLGYGRFFEPRTTPTPGRLDVERLLFATNLERREVPLTPGGRLALSLDGTYRQFVYPGEKAALYTLTHNAQLLQRLGTSSTLSLSYGYLRPYGGLPIGFQLDQTGSNNNISLNLNHQQGRTRLTVLTGYDIQRARGEVLGGGRRNPWQNLGVQLSLRPAASFQTRFSGGYDINSGRLIDLTNRARWRFGESFALDTGLRYDPRARKLAQATETLSTWIFSRNTRLGIGSSYNGFTKRFDYKNAVLTQSFHDYELTFSFIDQPFGFRSERGFNIGFRLKAFPSPATSTAGRFGTPLDTGVGDIF